MKDKIAVFSAILLGAVVGLFATLSFIIDVFVINNIAGVLIDIIIMVCSGTENETPTFGCDFEILPSYYLKL